jgi:hypothetical protein
MCGGVLLSPYMPFGLCRKIFRFTLTFKAIMQRVPMDYISSQIYNTPPRPLPPPNLMNLVKQSINPLLTGRLLTRLQ